jgi:hypothetical protein
MAYQAISNNKIKVHLTESTRHSRVIKGRSSTVLVPSSRLSQELSQFHSQGTRGSFWCPSIRKFSRSPEQAATIRKPFSPSRGWSALCPSLPTVRRWSSGSAIAGLQGPPSLVSRVRHRWSPGSAVAGLQGPPSLVLWSPSVPSIDSHPRTWLRTAASAGTFLPNACSKSGGSSKLERTIQPFEPPSNRPGEGPITGFRMAACGRRIENAGRYGISSQLSAQHVLPGTVSAQCRRCCSGGTLTPTGTARHR